MRRKCQKIVERQGKKQTGDIRNIKSAEREIYEKKYKIVEKGRRE